MSHLKTKVFALLACVGLVSACAGNNVARYERSGDRGFLGSIMVGSNAHERQMAEGIYELGIGDARDQNEISPTKMMFFFAAELTKEKAYEAFVILPSDEKPYQPHEVKQLRKRVLRGEFNAFMKKPSIRVKTTTKCQGGVCWASYTSRAIIVMLKGAEKKKVRALDANKVYAKLKPEIPDRPKRGG